MTAPALRERLVVGAGCALALVVVVLYFALERREWEGRRGEAGAVAREVAARIGERLEGPLQASERMARRWDQAHGTPRTVWESDAGLYVQDFDGIVAVEWVDGTGVRWSVPEESAEADWGERCTEALGDGREARRVLTSSFEVAPGGLGCLLCRSVADSGFLVTVLRYDPWIGDVFLEARGVPPAALSLWDGDERIFGDPPTAGGDISTFDVPLGEWTWTLLLDLERVDRLAPHSWLPAIVLLSGLATLALAATALVLATKAAEGRRELERTAERLGRSLADKEVLLREVHHRVKNNLQLVSSLLSLQFRGVDDPKALGAMRHLDERLHAMALLHESLSRSDADAVDFDAYLTRLVSQLAISLGRAGTIELRLLSRLGHLPLDRAIPLALIVAELVSNAYEHAFPNGRSGVVSVTLGREGAVGMLTVTDDGVGLAPDAIRSERGSLGLVLVESLTQQIHGSLHQDPVETGTRFRVELPL